MPPATTHHLWCVMVRRAQQTAQELPPGPAEYSHPAPAAAARTLMCALTSPVPLQKHNLALKNLYNY